MLDHHSTLAPIQSASPDDCIELAQVTLAKMRAVRELLSNRTGSDIHFLLIDLIDLASDQLEQAFTDNNLEKGGDL